MEKNFNITSSVYLLFEEKELDLHNDYSLTNVEIKIKDGGIVLYFSNQDQKRMDCILSFQKVKYFELSSKTILGNNNDIDEVGFKNPKDYDYDWLIGEDRKVPEDHLVFRFCDDSHIRIFSERVIFAFI